MRFFYYRYSDGTVKLRNSNIELMDQDILYHLALGSESHDLQEMFGDVKVSGLITGLLNYSLSELVKWLRLDPGLDLDCCQIK